MKSFIRIILLLIVLPAHGQSFLDSTFAENGLSLTFDTYDGTYLSIAIQPDNKIIVAGGADGAVVKRFDPTGVIDNLFGSAGVYTMPYISLVRAIALQSDSKIVSTGLPDFRLDINGTLDTTFGHHGLDTFGGYAIAVQGDDKILIAGTDPLDIYLSVERQKTDGFPDSTFGINGVVTSSFAGRACGVAQMTDGHIVVAGYNQPQYKLLAMRLLPDGSADTSFNHSGINSMFGGDSYNIATAMLLQPNGKIIVAGSGTRGSEGENFTIVRFNKDGSIDRSFGDTGVVIIDFASDDDRINAICLAANGEIVAAGFATIDHHKNFALVRLDSNGQIDSLFGIHGRITTDIHDSVDIINAVAIQPDGKILAAGNSYYSGHYYSALVRYLGFSPEDLPSVNQKPVPILFPNPAKGTVYIKGELNDITDVTVSDMLGRCFPASIDKASGTISFMCPAPGVYNFCLHFTDRPAISQAIIIR